jgi:hypothetical protein
VSPIIREHYRVPRQDRATYIRPAPADLPAAVERNRRLIASWEFRFAGRPVAEYRAAARAETIALARQYARRWGFCIERDWAEPAPIIATGHQPTPFHPGVWIKNFLAGSLAAATAGVAVSLIVDNDEGRGQVLRFPSQNTTNAANGGQVSMAQVALAKDAGGAAFEEQPASVLNPGAACEVRKHLPSGTAAGDAFDGWWSLVQNAQGAATLGEVLTAARRRLEEGLGLRNLDLPVSRLVDGEAFRLFVAEMLRRRDELLAAHNDALAEYRAAYRERSAAQPVPDLARRGPRVELPLWVWRTGERRRRLWSEDHGGTLHLLADGETMGVVPAAGMADARAVAARLDDFRGAGWKIRPRALTLTLFVRLAFADAFIHGLGGALYEKITDGIFERLFGAAATEIVLASCTVHLPLRAFPSTARDLQLALRRVRDWRYNPDRLLPGHVCDGAGASALIEEKRRLIATRRDAREARARAWRRIRQINQTLAALWPDGPRRAEADLAAVRRELGMNAILQNREYPFCFYPATDLAAFYREATGI